MHVRVSSFPCSQPRFFVKENLLFKIKVKIQIPKKKKIDQNFITKRDTEDLRSFLECSWSKYIDYKKMCDIHCEIVHFVFNLKNTVPLPSLCQSSFLQILFLLPYCGTQFVSLIPKDSPCSIISRQVQTFKIGYDLMTLE